MHLYVGPLQGIYLMVAIKYFVKASNINAYIKRAPKCERCKKCKTTTSRPPYDRSPYVSVHHNFQYHRFEIFCWNHNLPKEEGFFVYRCPEDLDSWLRLIYHHLIRSVLYFFLIPAWYVGSVEFRTKYLSGLSLYRWSTTWSIK